MDKLTDSMRKITRRVARATSDEQSSEAAQKDLEIFRSSKSETEYIQRMKEAFPHVFKD